VAKVKVEKADDDSFNEDEDKDKVAHHRIGHDDNTRVVHRIYKKAYKILKLKLYFENFFPADDKKDSLPYGCWISAVASIGKIDGGPAVAQSMFYDYEYDKKVRVPTSHPIPQASLAQDLTTPLDP